MLAPNIIISIGTLWHVFSKTTVYLANFCYIRNCTELDGDSIKPSQCHVKSFNHLPITSKEDSTLTFETQIVYIYAWSIERKSGGAQKYLAIVRLVMFSSTSGPVQ